MSQAAQDTPVDNQENQQYNPANVEDVQERLQQEYYDALSSDDAEKIAEVESRINAFLGKTEPPADEPEDEAPNNASQEDQPAENQGESEGATPAKDGDSQQTATEDWLNGLDPKVRDLVVERLDRERKAREYHEQKYKSDIGRITAYKDKYEKERKAREELEAKIKSQPAQQPVEETRTQSQIASDNAKLKALNEQITAMKNTDPELASSLETLRDAFLEEINRRQAPKIDPSIDEFKKEFEQQKLEVQIERERYELERRVPGSLQVIDYVDQRGWSPWREFLGTLPPKLQEAADEPSADNYEMLMQLYIPWAERFNAAHAPQTEANPQATQATSQPDPRAAQVQASRQQKMVSSNAAAPVKSTPPPQGRGITYEDLIQQAMQYDRDSKEYEALVEKAHALAAKEASKA